MSAGISIETQLSLELLKTDKLRITTSSEIPLAPFFKGGLTAETHIYWKEFSF